MNKNEKGNNNDDKDLAWWKILLLVLISFILALIIGPIMSS